MVLRAIFYFLILVLGAPLCLPGLAREQWQVQHPGGPPPTGPISLRGGVSPASLDLVPKIGADFWKGKTQQHISYGTVFSGILQEDISSLESKPGDLFQLELQDGYFQNGLVLIPPHSKILGTITTVTPAKNLRFGQPGRIDVSLQSLVFPDGASMPIHAFIDQNPNHAPKEEAQTRYAGFSLKDYGQSVSSFFGSFTTGIGRCMNKKNRGLDFKLKKGEVVPIRLTRSLDIAEPGSRPGLAQTAPGGPPAVPGLVGPDPDAPVIKPAVPANQMAPQAGLQASPGLLTLPPAGDPNGIFNQPIRPLPLSDMPDPF